MKTRFQEHFGERMVQTKINGKPNVFTFRTKQQEKENTAEKIKIVKAATKLIREDIKGIGKSHETNSRLKICFYSCTRIHTHTHTLTHTYVC